jgi:hypothetical protein
MGAEGLNRSSLKANGGFGFGFGFTPTSPLRYVGLESFLFRQSRMLAVYSRKGGRLELKRKEIYLEF